MIDSPVLLSSVTPCFESSHYLCRYSDLSDVDVEQIYSIIETMPPGYRMVFNLFAIEGYSHKEISELLQISESTSKSQLRKGRMNIIEKINKIKNNGKT